MYLTDVEEGGETVFPHVPKLQHQTLENGWSNCSLQVSSCGTTAPQLLALNQQGFIKLVSRLRPLLCFGHVRHCCADGSACITTLLTDSRWFLRCAVLCCGSLLLVPVGSCIEASQGRCHTLLEYTTRYMTAASDVIACTAEVNPPGSCLIQTQTLAHGPECNCMIVAS